MNLNSIHFEDHERCEALTASILMLPSDARRDRKMTTRNEQKLWSPTDPPTDVHLLESGLVEITETNVHGKSTMLRSVRPGALFGYLCFCDHKVEPHGTEARVVSAGVVHRTSYANFNAALKQDASLVSRLTESLCSRVAEGERRMKVLATHDASERLGKLLLHLVNAKAENSSHRTVALHVSHASLAAQASLTRPHTTVLMTRFRKGGYLSYGRGTAVQVNVKKLEELLHSR